MKISKNNNALICAGLALSVFFVGCKKDKEEIQPITPTYTVPTSYNFSNANYAEQTSRISMLSEINSETAKGTTGIVSATKLKELFSNSNNQFTNATLNTSGFQIKDRTLAAAQALIESFMDSVAKASTSTASYSNGVAGVAQNSDATKKYLFAANGIEYRQVIAKTLMGAFLFNQIKTNYLSSSSMSNSLAVSTLEHNWDLAFGTFGVPVDFPTNTTGLLFLGGYSDEVNATINSNKTIMDAFLKGRAAISNKDFATKDAQLAIVTSQLEKVLAAGAVLELEEAISDFSDNAVRNHVISEGMGFIIGLKLIPGVKITEAQANTILGYFGDNLYNVSLTNIQKAIDDIKAIYSL